MIKMFQQIAIVKTPLSLAAFAIVALLALYKASFPKPNASARRVMWVLIWVFTLLALVPFCTDAYLKREKLMINTVYRVRVTVVGDENVPIEDAAVRVTAVNEVKTASDGSAELAIPRGSLPQDGKVTIFADKEQAFLHGHQELSLADDTNPSVIIFMAYARTAIVNGAVQDEAGHGLRAVRVNIPGGSAVETDSDGNFRIPKAGAPGQKVLLHAEKPGYAPVSQYHPAGNDPVVLVLPRVR